MDNITDLKVATEASGYEDRRETATRFEVALFSLDFAAD